MFIKVFTTRLADVASLRACIDVVAHHGGFLAYQQAPNHDDLSRTLFSLAEGGSIHLVAKDEERVVGWVQIERGKGSAVSHRGDVGMGVLPNYQGRGIARELLAHAISLANAAGIHRLELEVRSDNRRALGTYSPGRPVRRVGSLRMDHRDQLGYSSAHDAEQNFRRE
jgi:ribosomal protein S18 acetylase RimI-like enzyme